MLSWFVWPPPAAPAVQFSPSSWHRGSSLSNGQRQKMWPLPQLPVPAHQAALLDARTLGSIPNPLQGKQANTFPSVAGWKGQTGSDKWLELAGPPLGVTVEMEHALLKRPHDNNQCLERGTWIAEDLGMLWILTLQSSGAVPSSST